MAAPSPILQDLNALNVPWVITDPSGSTVGLPTLGGGGALRTAQQSMICLRTDWRRPSKQS
jgi:hypothetical protein